MEALIETYKRFPVAFTHGEGVYLYDESGRSYLDALSGIAVNTLGHAHPRFVQAVSEQASKLVHVSNLFEIKQQEKLAAKLAQLSGMKRTFFCNSGCEANEAAIKIARFFGHQKGIDRPEIIVFDHAFHGRTLAALSATANKKAQAGFEPLVEGFCRLPTMDVAQIKECAGNNVVAILLEVIQGEGGIKVCSDETLRELRQICDQNEWLLMLDEVQCGMGRTGYWFAYQKAGILPDVVTLAKGLGSGVPIGACLVSQLADSLLKPGMHGSTFGGNPLACQAALATLSVIEDEGLLLKSAQVGVYIRSKLKAAFQQNPHVLEVRGEGLMIGIELSDPCQEIVGLALQKGLIINVTNEKVIRLLPSLIFTEQNADELLSILIPLINSFSENFSL